MSTLKAYNSATGTWEYILVGKTGNPGRFTPSETAPVSPTAGDAWLCTASTGDMAGRQFIYYDNFWIETTPGNVGPQGIQGIQGIQGPTANIDDLTALLIAGAY